MAYPKLTDQPGALETARSIRVGEMSPREAVQNAIARIEHLDAHINAVVVCDFERALATAKAMDGKAPGADQPLYGVPMTVTESFDIAGLPRCWGHERFAAHIDARDARQVARPHAAGPVTPAKPKFPV